MAACCATAARRRRAEGAVGNSIACESRRLYHGRALRMTTALQPERAPAPRASLRPMLGRLGGTRGHWWLTIAALVLVSPALTSGMALADSVLALLSRPDAGVAGLHSHPFLLFSFTSGKSDDVHALIDQGVLLP